MGFEFSAGSHVGWTIGTLARNRSLSNPRTRGRNEYKDNRENVRGDTISPSNDNPFDNRFTKVAQGIKDKWGRMKDKWESTKYPPVQNISANKPKKSWELSQDDNPFDGTIRKNFKKMKRKLNGTNESVMLAHTSAKKAKTSNLNAKAYLHKNDDADDNPFDSKTRKFVKKLKNKIKSNIKK